MAAMAGAAAAAAPALQLASAPKSLRGLVACRACSLVKTYAQFYEEGCDNCDPSVLGMQEDAAQCKRLTTPFFDGVCGVFDPAHSWAAKWQGLNSLKPGLYALKVNEELDPDIKMDLRQKQHPYLRTGMEIQEQGLGGGAGGGGSGGGGDDSDNSPDYQPSDGEHGGLSDSESDDGEFDDPLAA
jgi:transcription elongation factor SPT4